MHKIKKVESISIVLNNFQDVDTMWLLWPTIAQIMFSSFVKILGAPGRQNKLNLKEALHLFSGNLPFL